KAHSGMKVAIRLYADVCGYVYPCLGRPPPPSLSVGASLRAGSAFRIVERRVSMSDIMRLASLIVVLFAVATGAALTQPELGCEQAARRWYAASLQLNYEPDEHDLAIQRRIVEKERVIDDLMAGQMTLYEAAARFRRLDEQSAVPSFATYSPGDSE